jgi:hypothetical protein
MVPSDYFMIIPGSAFWSAILWGLLGLVVLFLARSPAHQAIASAGRLVSGVLRMASRTAGRTALRVAARNREILLATGIEAAELKLESDFQRVANLVRRDLSGFPSLQQALFSELARLESNYRESTELPPPPPNWLEAVEAVARIPVSADTASTRILEVIHKTTISQFQTAMAEYRKNMGIRHQLLKRMLPSWRKVSQALDRLEGKIARLQTQSQQVDQRMGEYAALRSGTDPAVRALTASTVSRFVLSLLVLLVMAAGVMLNFNLIALPMSELVGAGSTIGRYQTADVMALVLILLQLAVGGFLMEALRLTRIFPAIGNLEDQTRTRVIWGLLALLLLLAGVEAGLAFLRDRIAADIAALHQSLADLAAIQPVDAWIPAAGYLVLGLILPFILAFSAVPLEAWVHAARIVFGALLQVVLETAAWLLRLGAHVIGLAADLLVRLYDLLIFPSLWADARIRARRAAAEAPNLPQEMP